MSIMSKADAWIASVRYCRICKHWNEDMDFLSSTLDHSGLRLGVGRCAVHGNDCWSDGVPCEQFTERECMIEKAGNVNPRWAFEDMGSKDIKENARY